MRGKIIFPERKQQINDFSGLLFGRITPTDIDGLIEYHDRAYVIFETKYLDAKLPHGQRLAFERMVNDFRKADKKAIAIIAEHNIHDTSKPVPVAECIVREYYSNPQNGWANWKKQIKVSELTRIFLRWVDTGILLGA